jgi:hypothetical protein
MTSSASLNSGTVMVIIVPELELRLRQEQAQALDRIQPRFLVAGLGLASRRTPGLPPF